MQRTLTKPFAACIVAALLLACMPFAFAQAHGDEDHSAEAPKHEKTVAELEAMLALLQKLVVLLQAQKALGGTVTIPAAITKAAPAEHADDDHGEEVAGHNHDNVDDSAKHESAKTFAIEVEEHNGKTHVHIRYIDKPEVQTYVDANIDDEDALIKDIMEKTGLPKSVIEPALVYL